MPFTAITVGKAWGLGLGGFSIKLDPTIWEDDMKRVGLLLVATLVSPLVTADDRSWPSEIRVTSYLTDFGTDITVDDTSGRTGTDLDLEDEFDLEETLEELRFDLRWRVKPKHLLDFAYYDISRSGHRTITRSISVGDQDFVVGTDLVTDLEFKVYKLGYAYSFSQSVRHDATLSIGLHMLDLGLSVDGELLNVPVDSHVSDLSVPLPVVGGQYSRKLGERFTFNIKADIFAIEYDNIKGSLVDLNTSIDWDFTSRFGATLGYNFVDMEIDSDNSDFRGDLNYRYDAITIGVRLLF
jgi:hypothetical protein